MDNIFFAIIMVLIALVALLGLAYLEMGRSQSDDLQVQEQELQKQSKPKWTGMKQ